MVWVSALNSAQLASKNDQIATNCVSWRFKVILEDVAINDVLPLKAARRDAIANLKCFGAADTRDLISMVTFTITMRRHLIRLASALFLLSVWQRLVGIGFRVQLSLIHI